MAKRPAWTINNNLIIKQDFEFEWNGGFAISQKQKNILNLHLAISKNSNDKVLEISTKSTVDLGMKLSAFNLKLNGYFLENIFQSSKKYINAGPYKDLLLVEPKDAKCDERHKNSGDLIAFCYDNIIWDLLPKTAFYDYIYIKSVLQTFDLNYLDELITYNWFTDIEFNPQKSINCQARAAAILKYVYINDNFNVLNNKEEWISFHKKYVVD